MLSQAICIHRFKSTSIRFKFESGKLPNYFYDHSTIFPINSLPPPLENVKTVASSFSAEKLSC
jgi:hypothetical protein